MPRDCPNLGCCLECLCLHCAAMQPFCELRLIAHMAGEAWSNTHYEQNTELKRGPYEHTLPEDQAKLPCLPKSEG